MLSTARLSLSLGQMASRGSSHAAKSGFLRRCGEHIRTQATSTVEQTIIQRIKSDKIASWLLVCSGLVAGEMIVGGVKRLREAQLSDVEREKYTRLCGLEKLSEKDEMSSNLFKLVNLNWMHGICGSLTNWAFFLPAACFWSMGMLRPGMKVKTGIFGAFLALQKCLDSDSLKSSLNNLAECAKIDMSSAPHYIAASRVASSLLLYAGLLSMGFDHLLQGVNPGSWWIGKVPKCHILTPLMFVGAFASTFLAYNYSTNKRKPLEQFWRDFFENPEIMTIHSCLLGSIALATVLLHYKSAYFRYGVWNLENILAYALKTLSIMAFLRSGLELSSNMIWEKPSSSASWTILNQSSSLALLCSSLFVLNLVRRVK